MGLPVFVLQLSLAVGKKHEASLPRIYCCSLACKLTVRGTGFFNVYKTPTEFGCYYTSTNRLTSRNAAAFALQELTVLEDLKKQT